MLLRTWQVVVNLQLVGNTRFTGNTDCYGCLGVNLLSDVLRILLLKVTSDSSVELSLSVRGGIGVWIRGNHNEQLLFRAATAPSQHEYRGGEMLHHGLFRLHETPQSSIGGYCWGIVPLRSAITGRERFPATVLSPRISMSNSWRSP